MRVTPHSTLAISTCALALLSQLPSVHSTHGLNTLPRNFIQQYVDDNMGRYKLSNIRWSGGSGMVLRLARVDWHHHDAFMKCDKASNEVDAFKALDIMKTELKEGRLSKDYAAGQQNVMEPLHRFGFTRNGPVDIDLADFDQLYILPQVTQGLLYIYNAGILHKDVAPRNIMLVKIQLVVHQLLKL
ncbi:hypothetical protein BDF22DRAFT_750520 [Syncephalis plumigaleata]|nr:hypothetical protein BDF22DRAFT_750520 [Syncephalis plumigaleata]